MNQNYSASNPVNAGGQETGRSRKSMSTGIGMILIVIGAYALIQQFLPWKLLRWSYIWPVLVILLGWGLLKRKRRSWGDSRFRRPPGAGV